MELRNNFLFVGQCVKCIKVNFSFLIYQRQFLVNSSITGKAGSSTILCSDSVQLYGSKYLTLCPMSNSQGIFQTQLFCY